MRQEIRVRTRRRKERGEGREEGGDERDATTRQYIVPDPGLAESYVVHYHSKIPI